MKKLVIFLSLTTIALCGCTGNVSSDGTGLSNGRYSAVGMNFNGTSDVTVTIRKNRIVKVDVVDDGTTYSQFMAPYDVLPDSIVSAQSTDVDGVTGATFTSDAIKMGVEAALAQARGEKSVVRTDAPVRFTPGTYTGSGKGYGGEVLVQVTFSEDSITDIKVIRQHETAHIGESALPVVASRVIDADGLGVDAVTGATYSTHALKTAVLDAAEQAGVTNRDAFILRKKDVVAGEPVEGTWDIVIVGGGGAGMCAATQAVQEGNSVLVIEKNAELGGNTLVAGGVYQSIDHSLVWDISNPEATTAKGFDGKEHNKVRSTVGCINDLKIIAGWNEEPFDVEFYRTSEFVAGDIREQSKHGVHQEFLPTLQALKKEISAYLKYAEPKLAKGVPETQLVLFSTTNLHVFQTYYGGLRQSTDKSEWIYGDYELIRQFVEEGEQLKPWLMGMGVGFTDSQSTLIGALWYRGNSMTGCRTDIDGDGVEEFYSGNWGSYFAPHVAAVRNGNPSNRIMCSTTAEELISENGRVTGVKAVMDDGTKVTAHARKGVLIASGGYAANIQKVLKSNRYWSRLFLSPTIGTTNRSSLRGDGIDMATAVGAATVGMGWTQLMPLSNVNDGSIAFGGVENAIFVSPLTGKRYVDECSERDVLALSSLKNGMEWHGVRGVFLYITQGFGFGPLRMNDNFGGIAGFGGVRENNTLKSASCTGATMQSVFDELGIDVDAEVVKNTIREYDYAVMDGVSPVPGKAHAPVIIGSARRDADGYDKSSYDVENANFMFKVLAPATHHTMGGLKVDLERHVLDESGKPIPGLYAAGEVTGGFFGGNRLGGNALTEVMASGRIAARTINREN
mgnify:CR=1 FL=1